MSQLIDIDGRRCNGEAMRTLGLVNLPWLWHRFAIGREAIETLHKHSSLRVRWLLGGAIGLIEQMTTAKVRAALPKLRPTLSCCHDDIQWRDLLQLAGEALDCLWRFLKSRSSTLSDTEDVVC